jgi:CRISPR-associated protein Csb3
VSTPNFRINVDPTNPGQFFACCGLLELADRLASPAEGWFEGNSFCLTNKLTLHELLDAAQKITPNSEVVDDSDDDDGDEDEEEGDDDTDAPVVPINITSPIRLRLDWWGDKALKTWAGSMKVELIFFAMCGAIDPSNADPLFQAQVVYDPKPTYSAKTGRMKKPKKREPFYFDAARGANAHSIDVGFSTNKLKMLTLARPVVEAMALVGLQRCRPVPLEEPRHFRFSTWRKPLPPELLPAAIAGFIDYDATTYRFVNAFRSGQKKHKTFTTAIPTP